MKSNTTTCRALLITLLNVCFLYLLGHTQHLTYTNFTYKDGLPTNNITSVYANKLGTVFLGSTHNSLFSFDGSHFKEYRHSFNRSSNSIIKLIEHGQSIYALSSSEGILKLEDGLVTLFYKNTSNSNQIDFYYFNNHFYLFSSESCQILDQSGKVLRKLSYAQNENIRNIKTIIPFQDKLLVLGDHSNLIVSQNHITPLSTFFNLRNEDKHNFTYGYNVEGVLHLYNSTLSKGIIIYYNTNRVNVKYKTIAFDLGKSEEIIGQQYDSINSRSVYQLNNGDILFEKNYTVERFPKNYNEHLNFTCFYLDFDGNIWSGTKENGLIKEHFSFFTKLNYKQEYNQKKLSFTHSTPNNTLLFSLSDVKSTWLGNIYEGDFKVFPFQTFDKYVTSNQTLLATSNGVYTFNEQENTIAPLTKRHLLKGKKITSIVEFENGFLIIEDHKRSYYYCLSSNIIEDITIPKIEEIGSILTLNYNKRKKILYIGTNKGLYSWDSTTNTINRISNAKTKEVFSGTTTDIFGTIWFINERELIGITASGKKVHLNDPFVFKNTIFHNIEADSYGQLLLGTNRGFNVVKVNNVGTIISHKNFDSDNGFEGYTTNLHSSSILNNKILIGTSDGLFCIDLDFHNNNFTPSAPVITDLQINENNGSLTFKTKSLHSKYKEIYYSYKIAELPTTWSDFSKDDKYTITGLLPGKYTLLVRSSFDKEKISDTTTSNFKIHQTFNSNAYIVYISAILGGLITLIIFLRVRNRNLDQEFYKEDFFILQHISPFLILATGLLNFLSHLIGYLFIPNFYFNFPLLLIGLLAVILLYLYARRISPIKRYTQMKAVVIAIFLVILIQNEYILYKSNLDPFLCISVLIIANFSPFIFEKTINILLFGVVFFFTNVTIAFALPESKYNPELYTLAITTAIIAFFFINTIRHQSLNKLAYISTIINNSDIYSVAFDKTGTIIYSTANLNDLLYNDIEQLTGQPINILLQYVPKGIEITTNDIAKEFKEGHDFYLPIQFNNDPISWIHWECKLLNKNTLVLLGTDITEKIALENTYEILVENAKDLIYKLNTDGEFQFLNKKFNDYLEEDKNNFIGQSILEIIHPDYRNNFSKYFKSILTDTDPNTYFEFPVLDKFGETHWIAQNITVVREIGFNKKIEGFLATARDITEKRKQEQVITKQSNNIKDSLNYAKRIQKNLMNSGTRFSNYFDEYTIIFKPKDIVSGDFYWCIRIENKIVIAVGDCTGHGVPGAFMSILAINLLNTIVITSKITDSGAIMNELDIRLKSILNNPDDTNFRDGVELTICTIDNDSNLLQYSCAGSKFIIHNGQSFDIFRGDLKHIGDDQDYFGGYVTHTLALEKNSTIYLFTDGCHDQFGGHQNKKFTMKRLIDMIADNINLPLKNQGIIFTQELANWQGNQIQTDDTTLVAVRPKNND